FFLRSDEARVILRGGMNQVITTWALHETRWRSELLLLRLNRHVLSKDEQHHATVRFLRLTLLRKRLEKRQHRISVTPLKHRPIDTVSELELDCGARPAFW